MEQKTKAFQERVGGAVAGHVEIMLAILGDQKGFFKDLANNGPGSSSVLAKRNKVNERYMREWLNGMVASKYLSFDSSSSSYSIPPENIPVLAQEFGPFSMGGFLNLLGTGETVLSQVDYCFDNGGGVPYEAYPDSFWRGLERHTGCNFENFLVPWLSLMDKERVEKKLKDGCRVCDVGCGRGRALLKLAKQFPNSTFVGYEIMEHAVKDATRNAQEQNVTNLSFSFISPTMEKLPSSELFDIIFVFDVIHDSAQPGRLLKALRDSLKDDGIFECLDLKCFDDVKQNNVICYGMSLLYCMTTSLHQNGAGLGAQGLTESVMTKLCKEAGFSDVKLIDLKHPFNVIWEVRP